MPELVGTITSIKSVKFNVDFFGVYAINVTARCEQECDLKVPIDDLVFREVPPEKNIQTYNIPSAWNGSKLKGLAKTIIFILPLNSGEHTLSFFPKKRATVESWGYEFFENIQQIAFKLDKQAEDGDRRPWYTFAFINTPLKAFSPDVTTSWQWRDGDDVKIVVDGVVKTNPNGIRQKEWLLSSTLFKNFFQKQRELKLFNEDLAQGIHYVEFWADRTPILHQVTFDLGDFHPKRVPTKNDPKWTEDFNDDTDQMLLARLVFGEARNQSKEAMIGVAWVIKNRLLAKRTYFGFNYHEIISKNNGRYYQFSSFIPDDPNFKLLIDPFSKNEERTRQAWFQAYDVSSMVVNDDVKDPTGGATFFHSEDFPQEVFITNSVPGAIYLKTIGDFLFYKDPNET